MKGCMSKKIISSLLSLVLCITAVPMVSLTSSAAGTVTPKIVSGQFHTVILRSDGTVLATGSNEFGQLGVGESGSKLAKVATFTQCVDETGDEIKDAFDIACSGSHTAVIRREGELWQCGKNDDGELGTGKTTSANSFTKSYDTDGEIKDAKVIACGLSFTAVIRKDGRLWQCGSNSDGQLGIEGVSSVSKFEKSQDSSGEIKNAKMVACGLFHTAVIREGGGLWQCGHNGNGQLGTKDTLGVSKFVQSQYAKNVIDDAKAVECGDYHTAVIRGNGELWQCGKNEKGQLGTGDTKDVDEFVQSCDAKDKITNAKAVSGGWNSTAVIRESGELWQCGYNEKGQLGTGDTEDVNKFVQSCDAKGKITNVKAVASAKYNQVTLILSPDINGNLELWGIGGNSAGQLGLGKDSMNDYVDQTIFVKAIISDIGKVPDILTTTKIGTTGNYSSRNVTGAGEFENVISVEITWGALTYNYNATWNSAEQKWNESNWSVSEPGADMITVTNNSSSAYDVSLAFTVDNAYDASSASGTKVEGSFVTTSFGNTAIGNNNTLKLTTTAADKTGIAYLKLIGMSDKITGLENDLTDKTVGTVTATLQKPSV